MTNTQPTIEHLKKQIEFYEKEETRVLVQLQEIQGRLNSDRAVLDILEDKKGSDSLESAVKAQSSITDKQPSTLHYTGTQEGIGSIALKGKQTKETL